VIDLHLHTTASDGALAPPDLVARAAGAGLSTISVTDHDTVAGLAEARAAAAARGMTFITGIEITAVEAEHDVHVLGYFVDPDSTLLGDFLATQRTDRLRRVREMCDRLNTLGIEISAEAVIDRASAYATQSVGRPAIADALVRSGHARDREDAFGRLIGHGCPAYVPRRGVSAQEVVRIIDRAGGIASLAHPVLAGIDHLIPSLASSGLAAIEARHIDHPPETEARYRAMASRLGLAVSGGSDFHGDATANADALGKVTLPPEDFAALAARARNCGKHRL
jgi:predicted metal-dependent phosphoesterase TrpH